MPDFSAYMSRLPPNACSHLKLKLDHDHEGVDKDLYEIAEHMLGWDKKLSTHLELTEVDIHDIKAMHSHPSLQR